MVSCAVNVRALNMICYHLGCWRGIELVDDAVVWGVLALCFDVFADDFEWCSSSGCEVVGLAPEVLFPEVSPDFWVVLLNEPAAGALVAVHEFAEVRRWFCCEEEVDVIWFASDFFASDAVCFADSVEYFSEFFFDLLRDDFLAVFGYDDEMIMHVEYRVVVCFVFQLHVSPFSVSVLINKYIGYSFVHIIFTECSYYSSFFLVMPRIAKCPRRSV